MVIVDKKAKDAKTVAGSGTEVFVLALSAGLPADRAKFLVLTKVEYFILETHFPHVKM